MLSWDCQDICHGMFPLMGRLSALFFGEQFSPFSSLWFPKISVVYSCSFKEYQYISEKSRTHSRRYRGWNPWFYGNVSIMVIKAWMSNYNCLTMMILRKCRANYEELTSLINNKKLKSLGMVMRTARMVLQEFNRTVIAMLTTINILTVGLIFNCSFRNTIFFSEASLFCLGL